MKSRESRTRKIRRGGSDVCGPAGRFFSAAASVRIAIVAGALISQIAVPAFAQQPRTTESAARKLLTSIKDRIRAEAAKVDRAEVSPLFAAITGPAAEPELRLRDEQIQLCRKLESLARDIVRAWLLRGLDDDPAPEASRLEVRLADQGKSLREAVFAHAEVMALEGILDPEQASTWYKKSKTKPKPRLPSRCDVKPGDPPPETATADTLARDLRLTVSDLGRSGLIFDLILGSPWIERVYPDGFENLDPARKQLLMKERDMPQAVLSPEQAGLTRRLDGMTREIIAAWLVRGLDDQPVPSRATLAQRRQVFPLVGDALNTRAEVIVLEAILATEQSDRILAVLWTRMGTTALLDPAMASRLKLTRAQREEARALIDSKYEALKEIGAASLPIVAQAPAHPELYHLLQAMEPYVENQRNQADAAILSVLKPSQMRTMTRLLAPAADRKTDKPKSSK